MLVGGSRLESCTCAAAGAWAGCYEGPHDGWGWEGSKRDKGGWPLRQGHMCSEDWRILQGSVVAVLAVGFLSGESCWGPLQRRSLGTTDAGVTCFLPYSYLSSYVSALPVSRSGVGGTKAGFSCSASKAWGSWALEWETVVGEFLLRRPRAGVGNGAIQAEGSSSYFPFLCGYFLVFCSTVLHNFLTQTPDIFQSCVCLWGSCLIIGLCWGTEAGVFYIAILVTSLLQSRSYYFYILFICTQRAISKGK